MQKCQSAAASIEDFKEFCQVLDYYSANILNVNRFVDFRYEKERKYHSDVLAGVMENTSERHPIRGSSILKIRALKPLFFRASFREKFERGERRGEEGRRPLPSRSGAASCASQKTACSYNLFDDRQKAVVPTTEVPLELLWAQLERSLRRQVIFDVQKYSCFDL